MFQSVGISYDLGEVKNTSPYRVIIFRNYHSSSDLS